MEEIKVNEYVRTDNGIIGKYTIQQNINYIDTGKQFIGFDIENDIVKHSPNIIDLIEEGDYVNGKKVSIVYTLTNQITFECVGSCVYSETILGDNIKSIVTKEMFNQVKYEV